MFSHVQSSVCNIETLKVNFNKNQFVTFAIHLPRFNNMTFEKLVKEKEQTIAELMVEG